MMFPKPPRTPRKPKRPLPRSSTPIARTAKPKPVNKKRKAREFARTYHSEERVGFVKALPCVACRQTPPAGCHNAHTTGGGMSRKGDYTSIVPLCARCHAYYDGWNYPLSEPHLRWHIEIEAGPTERAWQAHCAERGQP